MGSESRFKARLSRDEMERRRLLAAEDLRKGVSQAEVARHYGVNKSSVNRWAKRVEKSGVDSLRSTKAFGTPRLSRKHEDQLVEIVLDGALASGFETDLWTAERVALVIKRKWGVSYHPRHLAKLLKAKLRMSYQKPARQAMEKDGAKKEAWLRGTWKRLKKTRPGRDARLPR